MNTFDRKQLGLSKIQIEKIIENEFEKNSDILMGIDDPEVQELINVIKKAVIIAIDENNDQLSEDLRST